MANSAKTEPLTRRGWVWGRCKWAIHLGFFVPFCVLILTVVLASPAEGPPSTGQSPLMYAAMFSIAILWLVAPLIASYVHWMVTASDKTSGSLMGLGLMGLPVALIAGHKLIGIALLGLFPGFLFAGVLGLFGMLRTAGPRASIVKGVSLIKGSPRSARTYFEAAAFSEEFRPSLLSICTELGEKEGAQRTLALNLLEHLTRVAPEEANNWCARSFVAYRSGLQAESFEYLEEALKLEPRNAEIYYNRAVRRSNDPKSYELSLKDYAQAISLDGSEARYWANRAALNNRMGRHESALSDAKKAHQLDATDRVARGQAAIALTSLDRKNEVEDWMSVDSGLANLLSQGQDSQFESALSLFMQKDDSSALKANFSGETITLVGPDGVQQIRVDDLP